MALTFITSGNFALRKHQREGINRRHFTLELYNGLHSIVVHRHLRLLVRCDDACWEEALNGFDNLHTRTQVGGN